jgi:DNA-binding transcriptional ArsR family regulator
VSDDELFDSGDPFDDPLWKDAARHADGHVKPRAGYIGFPESWLERVLPIVTTKQQLAVALLLYRHLCYSKFVPITNSEFAALGIDRRVKYRTLTVLKRAKLIEVERAGGRALRVRLLG